MKIVLSASEASCISSHSKNLIPIPNVWMIIQESARLGCKGALIETQSFNDSIEKELIKLGYKISKKGDSLFVSWK